MPWVPFAMMAANAVASYLANRKKTQQQEQQINQTTNRSSSWDRTGTQMPTYDPQQLALRDTLLQQFLSRLSSGDAEGFANSLTANNAININQGSAIQKKLLESTLAARGLGYSPAMASGAAGLDQNRISSLVQNQNNRNMVLEQMIQQRLKDAGAFLGSLPVGTTTHETGTQIGQDVTTGNTQTTLTDPGNPWAGAATGIAATLSQLYGQGAFSQSEGQSAALGYRNMAPPTTFPGQLPYQSQPTNMAPAYNFGQFNLGYPGLKATNPTPTFYNPFGRK